MKLDKWHNAKKFYPSRPGVYEVEWGGSMRGLWYNYWDGENWHYGLRTVAYMKAAAQVIVPHDHICDIVRWRGVVR